MVRDFCCPCGHARPRQLTAASSFNGDAMTATHALVSELADLLRRHGATVTLPEFADGIAEPIEDDAPLLEWHPFAMGSYFGTLDGRFTVEMHDGKWHGIDWLGSDAADSDAVWTDGYYSAATAKAWCESRAALVISRRSTITLSDDTTPGHCEACRGTGEHLTRCEECGGTGDRIPF